MEHVGPTAALPAKPKLAIDDLAGSFGLDINTVTVQAYLHYLLRDLYHSDSDSDLLYTDHDRVSGIINRPKLPSIVGGSNPFIHDMLLKQYNPVQSELRHRFCFKCVDGLDPDLVRYLGKRIDETMDFEESWFPDWSTGLIVPEEVKEIKENTRYLTEKQMWKIQRVEAMEAYRRRCRRETARFRRPKFGKDKLYYRT
ncbi:hypothetical protein KY290_024021 [Solanum tuberosum]|uniref:Uncharacterized protein n=1 Tax=Solanum tuberosum TaxID=4113 RepID=A0ABQ7UPI7_SOLTU|nr:hypothetical protein KY285_022768 [Solanum tuberosum]KAH0753751.1 hypothetical protein KY290_024021 [Solanum tuberosum]